jgi:N-acyl-D-amino-acid deacylase
MAYAMLFRGATVVDGTVTPGYRADVAVDGERIATIGDLTSETARREIDAHGLVLSPGFIDVHAHSDLPLLADPQNEPKIRQGVTSELLGADGLSYAPLSQELLTQVRRYLAGLYGNPDVDIPSHSVAEFMARFDRRTAGNTYYVVPHQALRLMAGGWRGGPATEAQIGVMTELLEQGLSEGAAGLGTGLDYFPHGTCTTDELVALANVVARHDGVLVAHVRYSLGVVNAVREMVQIAERSGVRVLISHMRNTAALPVIDDARARGLDVQFDTYPYNAGSSMFLMFLPYWVHEGGPANLLERLRDREVRKRLQAEGWSLDRDFKALIISGVGANETLRQYEGRSLGWVMQSRGQSDPLELVCDLLIETELAIGFVAHGGSTEEGLRECIRHPAHLVSTDAVLVGRPHPRSFGTYPRYLGRYVRELGVLTLEECIRRMTSGPAACFRLPNRGEVRSGFAADLVLFNPETIIDRATFEEPRQYPEGIEMVVVNGQIVVERGQQMAVTPGRALRPSM